MVYNGSHQGSFLFFFKYTPRQAQLKLMFDELDEDGSGELTLDEINAAPAVTWNQFGGEDWRT